MGLIRAAWARLGVVACLWLPFAGCQPASQPRSPWDTVGDRTWLLPTAVGTPLAVDLIQPRGPELVVSRGPVRLTQPAVCLVRAQPAGRRFRVFAHHRARPGGGPVHFALRIVGRTDEPQALRVGPNSLALPGRTPTAAWTGPDGGAVGALAMHSFLEARAAGVPDADLVMIGEATPFVLGVTVEPGETWSFIAEFEADSTVEVGLFASRPGAEVNDDTPLRALPEDDLESGGLFAAADRRVLVHAPLDGKPHYVELGRPVTEGLPGEFETPPGNPGNQGVVYDVEVSLRNTSPTSTRAHLLMSMVGGPGGFSVIAQPDRVVRSWSALQLFETVRIGSTVVPAGGSAPARFTWSLPGGMAGPQRLYVWPDELLPPS